MFNSLAYVLATVALASSVFAQSWPDTSLLEPTGFKAFTIVKSSPCNAEIVFKRDLNDVKYDYYLFSADDGRYIQQTVVQDDTYNPFSVVNATATGQRGAYALGDGYTLVPLKITVCGSGGHRSPPSAYVVHAVTAGQGPNAQPVWTSPRFSTSENAVVPQGSGASPTSAKATGSNEVTVSWELSDPSADQVAGYFVIVGKQGATKLYGAYVDASATQATVQVAGSASNGYAATVVVYSKDGATPNVSACEQISVR